MVVDFSDQNLFKKQAVPPETGRSVSGSKKKAIYLAIIILSLICAYFLFGKFLSAYHPPATIESIKKSLPPGVPLAAPSLDKMPQVAPQK